MFGTSVTKRFLESAILLYLHYELQYTRKNATELLQTCKQVVTSLFTSCSQDVFALLVPNLLGQVLNKLLTNCNKLDGTIRPVTRLFQQD